MDLRRALELTLVLGAALLVTGCGALGYRAIADSHARRATMLFEQGEVEEGLYWMEQALAASPEDPTLLVTRAQMLGRDEQLDEARRDLERALCLAPDNPRIIAANAQERAASGDLEAALEITLQGLSLRPGNEDLLWQAGLFQLSVDRLDDAEATFGRLIYYGDAANTSYRVAGRLGLALARSEAAPAEARDLFAEAVRADMGVAISLAQNLAGAGLESTLRDLAAAAAANSQDDLAVGLANASVLQMAGFSDQAVAEVERLLELEPGREATVDLLVIAAFADADSSRFSGARERLRTAIDLEPTNVDALFLLRHAVIKGKGDAADFEDLEKRLDAAARLATTQRQLDLFRQLRREIPRESRP